MLPAPAPSVPASKPSAKFDGSQNVEILKAELVEMAAVEVPLPGGKLDSADNGSEVSQEGHLTCFGDNSAIFSRAEYQKDSGNLPHEHGILALDREAMNDVNVQTFLADQIRTSSMEIIKTEDIESLIPEGASLPPKRVPRFCAGSLHKTSARRQRTFPSSR